MLPTRSRSARSAARRAIDNNGNANVRLQRPRLHQHPASARQPPRALFVTTLHWATTTRLCLAFARRGFQVAALVPEAHALRGMASVTTFAQGGGGLGSVHG